MKVLLFSGGLDSFIISRLQQFDIALFCHIGLPENNKELNCISSLPMKMPLLIDRRLRLADEKLDNEIIPMRNLFFIMIGAYYGDEVTLGATAGDTTADKTLKFISLTNNLLEYLFENKSKAPRHLVNREFFASIPYKDFTKRELIKLYLETGENPHNLSLSRSCYSVLEKECGKCRSCVRKYAALKLNGIDCESWFAYDPRPFVEDAFNMSVLKRRGQETEDMKELLERI